MTVDGIKEKIEKGEALDETERKLVGIALKWWQNCRYEQIPDTPFIHGTAGKIREGDKMPEYFLICPTYGVDWSVPYKRVDK